MIPRALWAERRLGYRFAADDLLDLALTHRSASVRNNERLEFLGDAVLGAVIAKALFHRLPDAGEGVMSRMRARLVRGVTLAEIAREIDLGQFIYLGSGESRTGGHQRSSTLSNALEAVVGAVFLDGGMAAVEDVILRLYGSRLDHLPPEEELIDAKTRLQEWLQARGHPLPHYQVQAVAGAAHAQTFEVLCAIEAPQLQVVGRGLSRRLAEQDAASCALEHLAGISSPRH